MLALEYGYRVSPDCALAADGTNAAADGAADQDITAAKRLLWLNGGGFALVVLSLLLMYFVSLQFAPLSVLAVLLWATVFVVDALQSRKRPMISKLIVFPLSSEPWQAWPCRVEDTRGNPDSRMKLVYLMSPDQQVVRAFKAPMPEQVSKSIARGMVVLWVCGDLESPSSVGSPRVAMGTVDGDIVWGARLASRRDAMNAPRPSEEFSRFIDDASSTEMDRLLKP